MAIEDFGGKTDTTERAGHPGIEREDLDNAGDIVIDRSVPAERWMMEFLERLYLESHILKGFRRYAGR